jgi:small basic protein
MKSTFFILLLSIVIISGCKDNSMSSSNEYNSVNIKSVNDTLAESISTTNHTYNDTVQLESFMFNVLNYV